jgi:hypothetical protein
VTRGFAVKEELGVAVCLLPETELAFEHDVRYNRYGLSTKSTGFRVARFCAIQPRAPEQHHDALAFPDGNTVLVNLLSEGQRAGASTACYPAGLGVNTDVERALRPAAALEVAQL